MNDLLFSKNHIWIKNINKNTYIIGISNYAQEQLGSIIFINLPETGDNILANTCFGDMESIKTVSDLISPISGKILQVNEVLLDNPELLNDNPYENWLLEIDGNEVATDLMNNSEYLNYLEQL